MAIEVNTDTFEKEVVQSDRPVLVDFWGPRCVPCLALMPHLEASYKKMYEIRGLEKSSDGKIDVSLFVQGEKVKITKIDASKNRRLCLNLKVLDLPTFLFYKNGKEVNRLRGESLTIEEIEEAAKKIME